MAGVVTVVACKEKREIKTSLSSQDDQNSQQWSQEGTGAPSAEVQDSLPVGVSPTPVTKPGGPPIATLPGFKMLEGGSSRVFVEMSAEVDITETNEPYRLVYHLRGVQVPEGVNQMMLPTAHFNTPVHRVRLYQAGTDADLVVELRLETKAKTTLKPSPFGTMLSVEFPKVPEGAVFRTPPPASASAIASPGVPKTQPPVTGPVDAPPPSDVSGW